MTRKLAGAILLIVGVVLACITVIVERHQEKVFAGAVHTTGTIVALLPRGGSGNAATYAPIVRYRTKDGVSIDFTASLAAHRSAHRVGDRVPVVYTPLNPQQADIDSWTSRWLLTVLCGGLAAILSALALVTLLSARRPA